MIRGRFSFIFKISYLVFLLLLFSCKKKEKDYFETIASNDVKLSYPKPGEWRYNRNEKFQTFDEFQKLKKIIPEDGKNTIYLQPIGKFTDLQNKEIALTQDYLRIYFQLQVKVLPYLSNDIFPKSVKRIKNENEQILAGYVLDSILIKKKPNNAVVLMGITEKDLFPKYDWNYVFGLASYNSGVGVTSIYRFAHGNLTESNFNESLLRLIKISSHEIGHMFGIAHCLNANCVMNGSNNLSETDSRFSRACSLCQQKLNSSLQYDNKKRLNELKEFFQKQHLDSEVLRINADLKLLK